MKFTTLLFLFVLFFVILFSGVAFSSGENVVRVSGSALASGGVHYISSEIVWTDGKGIDWRLLRETINPSTGVVSMELVFRSGERKMFGYPLNAIWSVSTGKTFLRVIPGTDEHPPLTENQTIVVFVCSGWGGENPGSVTGICKYLPVSNEVAGVVSDIDTATYLVPGASSAQVFRIGNFRNPLVSEKDKDGQLGIIFFNADCSSGTKVTRCLVGINSQQQDAEPRVVFLDGTNGWSVKLFEIQGGVFVEELPEVVGWSAELKVTGVVGGSSVERTAIATVLSQGEGETVLHVTSNPWFQ